MELALGYFRDARGTLASAQHYDELFLVAGRPILLPMAPRIEVDGYCAADPVLVSCGGADNELEATGCAHRVVLGLPAFLPELAAMTTPAALVTLPARLARGFALAFGLALAERLTIRSFAIFVFWRRGHDPDPRVRWLGRQLAEVTAEFDPAAWDVATVRKAPVRRRKARKWGR